MGKGKDEPAAITRATPIASHELFDRAVLDALPQAVAVLDARGVIVAANAAWPRAARGTGIPAEALAQGRNLLAALDAGGDDASWAHLATGIHQVLAGAVPQTCCELKAPMIGGERWISAYAAPVPGPGPSRIVLTLHDITADRWARKELRGEAQYRAVSELVSDYAYSVRVDPDGSETNEWVTDAFHRVTGYTPEEVDERGGALAIVHPGDVEMVGKRVAEMKAGHPDTREFRIIRKDGEVRWLRGHNRPEVDPVTGRIVRVIGAAQDITERKCAETQLRESNERLSALIEAAPVPILSLDRGGSVAQWNPAAEATFGWPADEVVGRACPLASDGSPNGFERLLADAWRGQSAVNAEVIGLRSREGRRIDAIASVAPVPDARGEVAFVFAVLVDITARKRAEDEVRYASTHDVLTGLRNRGYLEQEIERLQHVRDFPVSIVAADVDGLKAVNDSRGHAAGDRLLRRAADVFMASVRAGDVAVRLGGDEFAVLLPHSDRAAASQVLARIRGALAADNATASDGALGLSLGVSTARAGESLHDAFRRADERMYADKALRTGRPNRAPASSLPFRIDASA